MGTKHVLFKIKHLAKTAHNAHMGSYGQLWAV